jgi:hypothetical protein
LLATPTFPCLSDAASYLTPLLIVFRRAAAARWPLKSMHCRAGPFDSPSTFANFNTNAYLPG